MRCRAAQSGSAGGLETEMLAEEENFAGLAHINRELDGKVEAIDSAHRVLLDMDSTGSRFTAIRKTAPATATSHPYYRLSLFNREAVWRRSNGLTRRLFRTMVRRIASLTIPAG
jgi:hypothetical protein